MSDWNYGELINRRPHSHSVASNSTQPMETELSREREAHNKTKRERDEARDMVEKFTEQGLDLMDANRMLKRERDEAREEIKILRLDAQCEAEHHDRLVKELENLYDKLKS
jgi:hypothetical protein